MAMHTNGVTETMESPYASTEEEWETPELSAEDEWEVGESPYASGEDESPYATGELSHEDEWGFQESPYATEDELSGEWAHEAHFANESPYASPYASTEDEADQFLPLLAGLAPLAMKALPLAAKFALPAVKKLIPMAGKMVPKVLGNVLGKGGFRFPRFSGQFSGGGGRGFSGGLSVGGGGAAPSVRGVPGAATVIRTIPPQQRATVAGLFRQLGAIFGEGEQEAGELEAQLFGANEFEGELAAHEAAHEAALTEVLAAEAAHTESESEASALLGASLPITIRIMGARRITRPVMPTLVQANARLIRSIRRSGPAGPQLLRTVPAIQRRTIASLKAARRQGRPVTPRLVAQTMAGHAARVLGTPHLCGRALVRNTAIRQATVAPAGRPVRRPRPV